MSTPSFDEISVTSSAQWIDHGATIHTAPVLHGRQPKAVAQVESYSFHVAYEDVMVPMRDGVELAGDLYLPAYNGHVDMARRWPCVLVRTPYNKSVVNPDLRNPGVYWTQNGYCCFIQDCRGRFKSQGVFYKYTGEAQDGYDTVEWIAAQSWCNGSVVTDGPSYLCHVQTSMAILRPPHLKAMFCNKGGFFNAWTSGVRQGGAYEARQWIWGIKNASRKIPHIKQALEATEQGFDKWLRRYPFARGSSPLSIVPEYESYIFDQVENADYNEYWKQIGLNTEEYLEQFADIPALFFSGWYDIYCRSTIDFFVHLSKLKKGPILLIMGPWQHVGAEGHVAGEVDFGVNALVSGNLAPNMFGLSRRWFDRFVEPATIAPPQHASSSGASSSSAPSSTPRKLTPEEKLAAAIRVAEAQQQQHQNQQQQPPTSARSTSSGSTSSSSSSSSSSNSNFLSPSNSFHGHPGSSAYHHASSRSLSHLPSFTAASGGSVHSPLPSSGAPLASPYTSTSFGSPSAVASSSHGVPCGPYTSLSALTHAGSMGSTPSTPGLSDQFPSLYVLPSSIPRDRIEPAQPLPPPVRYFRMGGGDGHRTSQGFMFHGGVWMQSVSWPPPGTQYVDFFLHRRALSLAAPGAANGAAGAGAGAPAMSRRTFSSASSSSSTSSVSSSSLGVREGERDEGERGEGEQGEGEPREGEQGETSTSTSTSSSGSSSSSTSSTHTAKPRTFIPTPMSAPAPTHLNSLDHRTTYLYDPRDPCPSIGGNLFGYRNILLAGAYNQVERENMFLCQPPYLPLASRRDVIVFRTAPLKEHLDVSGMPVVHLFISSSAVDTDFTAKLIDEYPPSADYPQGFAMQVTHGIRRCRYRESRQPSPPMQPNTVYEIAIELYPTSNLFSKGHTLRLDISSSNFPHFDLNMNTGEEFESRRVVVAENTVWHTAMFPSRIVLPVQSKKAGHFASMMQEVSN